MLMLKNNIIKQYLLSLLSRRTCCRLKNNFRSWGGEGGGSASGAGTSKLTCIAKARMNIWYPGTVPLDNSKQQQDAAMQMALLPSPKRLETISLWANNRIYLSTRSETSREQTPPNFNKPPCQVTVYPQIAQVEYSPTRILHLGREAGGYTALSTHKSRMLGSTGTLSMEDSALANQDLRGLQVGFERETGFGKRSGYSSRKSSGFGSRPGFPRGGNSTTSTDLALGNHPPLRWNGLATVFDECGAGKTRQPASWVYCVWCRMDPTARARLRRLLINCKG